MPAPYPLEEYNSISDEDQGSSTKSSQAAAAEDVILPEATAATMDRSRQPAAPRGVHSPTESRIIAVLDRQQHRAKMRTDSKVATKRQCTSPSLREEGWKVEKKEEDPEEVYMNHLLRCCDNGDELDYYQLMAFYSASRKSIKDEYKHLVRIVKAWICAITQVLGMVIILVDFAHLGLEERGDAICNPPADFEGMEWHEALYHFQLKILAFLFSSFLAFYCFDHLTAVDKSGMYRNMKYAQKVKFLNIFWLRVGFSVNLIASILGVYGSFMVVFFSDNSLDMILNSVALFFVAELDDLLVKSSDYVKIGAHIQKYMEPQARRRRSTIDQQKKEKTGCCARCKRCGKSCCSSIVCCIAWMYTLPFQAVRYFTIAACFILPFFLGYCY
jgi:hypothetical protein